MSKKVIKLGFICVIASILFVGCGKEKSSVNEQGQNLETQETSNIDGYTVKNEDMFKMGRDMYNKTKDNMFLHSKYNSLNRFKTDIRNIAIIKSLSEIRPTKENIICKMKDDFNIDLEDNFNNYFNDILKTLKIEIDYCYLIGLCCSLNLLNNCNLDEQKSRFMK